MTTATPSLGILDHLWTNARLVVVTMFVCCVLYTLLILGIGQAFTPFSANGYLLYNAKGELVGSSQIAQSFTKPEYFWPRPSAVDYNAAATGGSNLSPASKELRERAEKTIALYGATADNKIPADLVTASGAGMDPHITLAGAEYQLERVAAARGLDKETVRGLIKEHTTVPGGPLTNSSIVNVLELNLALDALTKK